MVKDRAGERCIGDSLKDCVKQLTIWNLTKLVEKSMDDIPGSWYHNPQKYYPVVYKVVEHVPLDVLHKSTMGKALNAKKAKIFRHQCSWR